jgi:glutamate-1-semialdehyde 2,1-aminomutase
MAERLRRGLQEVADRNRMGLIVCGEGPMWHFLFADRPPADYRDILATDLARQAALEIEMIRQGLFVLPNNRRFVSITHTERDLEATFEAFDRACRAVRG